MFVSGIGSLWENFSFNVDVPIMIEDVGDLAEIRLDFKASEKSLAYF